MRRYIDLSGTSDAIKSEFYSLANEAEALRAEMAERETRAAATQRKGALAVLIAALLAGVLGFWRGRRAAKKAAIPRIKVTQR